MAKKKEDDTILRGAKARAAIQGYLSQNPGEHKVFELSEALSMTRGTAGQHLAHMAKSGLINLRKEGTSKLYSNGEIKEPAAKSKAVKVPKGRDVELVVSGTLIVIGRNPSTGRLRITLEEA